MALEYALTQYRIDKPVDELMRYWEELEPFSDVYLLRGGSWVGLGCTSSPTVMRAW